MAFLSEVFGYECAGAMWGGAVFDWFQSELGCRFMVGVQFAGAGLNLELKPGALRI